MTLEQLIAKQEIRELVDEFSILADNRDAKGQGPLFTEKVSKGARPLLTKSPVSF